MASVAADSFKVSFDSSSLKVVPSKSLPLIDFSALISDDPDRRSTAVHDLATACRDWGIFMLVNHGMPETLMNATFAAMKEFFSLPESEKKQYQPKTASDPIKWGNFNATNISNQTFPLWRDYLRLYTHPKFHCPHQPQQLRDVLLEYTERTRKLARMLMEAVCDALELDQQYYVDEVLKLDSSFEIFAANYYPPCPHPDQAIGIPLHTDPGLFTSVIHNGVAGLQIEHDGKWFNVDSPPNSILINAADQLEIDAFLLLVRLIGHILSNGRCKSVKHRALVNKERERTSIVVAYGPSIDAVVGPAAPLVKKDVHLKYGSMRYEDYIALQQTKIWTISIGRTDDQGKLDQNLN